MSVNREPIKGGFDTSFRVWLSPGFANSPNGGSVETRNLSDATLNAMVQRWLENTYVRAERPLPARFALPNDHQTTGASRASEGREQASSSKPREES